MILGPDRAIVPTISFERGLRRGEGGSRTPSPPFPFSCSEMKVASCLGRPTRSRRSVLLAPILAISSALLGATLQPKSLEQLVREADLIIQGRVQAVTPGSKGTLTTFVVVSVQAQWKGTKRKTVRLILPRGSEGGITQEVPGLPTFRIGEEVILFLVRDSSGEYEILAGKQGKFSIQTDLQTGKQFVEDLTGSRSDLAQFRKSLSKAK